MHTYPVCMAQQHLQHLTTDTTKQVDSHKVTITSCSIYYYININCHNAVNTGNGDRTQMQMKATEQAQFTDLLQMLNCCWQVQIQACKPASGYIQVQVKGQSWG